MCCGGDAGLGCRPWTLQTYRRHLAGNTHPNWAHFTEGETEAGGGNGAYSRWKRPDQSPGLLTPVFLVPSFKAVSSLVQSLITVPGSTLAILNMPASGLTPHPHLLEN